MLKAHLLKLQRHQLIHRLRVGRLRIARSIENLLKVRQRNFRFAINIDDVPQLLQRPENVKRINPQREELPLSLIHILADFGTRRRHSFLWQEYVVNAMKTSLGSAFTGTSNAFLAHKHDLEAIGTNAHEIPMVLAALTHDDQDLRASQYRVLELWQATYHGSLRIMLPDTFGTTQFLENAPDWAADWTGQRIDSKDPYVGGDEYIQWLKARGRDPHDKRIIASDALDVDDILGLHAYFGGTLANGVAREDFRSAKMCIRDRIEEQRPHVPRRAPVKDTSLAGKLVRHVGSYKTTIDTLRVALANAESELAARLAPSLPRPAEAKKTLANLFAAPGRVRVTPRAIYIDLAPAASPAERDALHQLSLIHI